MMLHKKKILFIIPSLTTGGAENVLANIINLIDNAYDVHIVTLLSNDTEFIQQNIRSEKVTLHALNMPKKYIYFPFLFYRLCKIISRVKPNLVHSFLFHSNVLSRFLKFFFKFKLINSIFDAAEEPKWYLALLWLTKLSVDRVTIDNSIGKRRYIAKKIVSKDRINYVPNGIFYSDEHTYNEKLANEIKNHIDYTSTEKIWLNISRFVTQKDHNTLVNAFEIFVKRYPNNKLLLVGDGILVEVIQKLIQEKNLNQKVFYLGRINDVFTLCKLSHFYVSASSWEGMSIVLMQAMRNNLPVIATQVGANVDLIKNNETGFLCERQSPQALYAAMQSAYCLNDEQIRIMTMRASATMKEQYSLVKLKHNWCKLYDSLLNDC